MYSFLCACMNDSFIAGINMAIILLLALVQTGDKSGEVTARMNLSDLRLVVDLKSNSNIYPNIFRNTNSNNLAFPVSYQGYSNFPGTSDSTE